jgi:hypothetical protein
MKSFTLYPLGPFLDSAFQDLSLDRWNLEGQEGKMMLIQVIQLLMTIRGANWFA